MKPSDFVITFEVEPIVKVVCAAIDCRNNLARFLIGGYCNLKHIEILEDGRCAQFERLIEDKAKQ